MAISINPSTKVISVPKADLTLIQTVPTEIRELDSNLFRHWLDDWMDSEQGIYMPKTHVHATEVLIDGLAYARTIEILAPYTVTFEDGQYQINIVGSNNNIHSRRNLNQVSIVPNNSAGLVNVRASEAGSFIGVVAVDTVYGVSGTTYPTGTHAQPTNNMADALLIATVRGLEVLTIHGSLTVGAYDISGLTMTGENPVNTYLTVDASATTTNAHFKDLFLINSVFDGSVYADHCYLSNASNIEGFVENSIVAGAIALSGGTMFFIDCKSGAIGLGSASTPVLDFAGLTDTKVVFRNWDGPVEIINSTHSGNSVVLNVGSAAHIKLGTTNTAGSVAIHGICSKDNASAMIIEEATRLDQASIGSAVATRALDGDITVEQALRVVMAALAGKRQGIGTATEQYFARDGVTPRITLTPDAAGNGLPILNGAI